MVTEQDRQRTELFALVDAAACVLDHGHRYGGQEAARLVLEVVAPPTVALAALRTLTGKDRRDISTGLLKVASVDLLRSAWDAVLANDRDDGVLGAGVSRFVRDADARLERIAAELAAAQYRPGLLTRVAIPRDNGPARLLHVPTVADRVVERAVLSVLTPMVDPWLGPWSFAYRPGLGVADAVQAVARLRDEGLEWAARADIADCFPSIPVGHLRRLVAALVDDDALRTLIEAFLARRSTGEGGVRAVAGLPQGSPLSPLWANLVLTRLDERLADEGFPVVRYSDDFVVLAASRDDAWEAMRVASAAVGDLGMRLGSDKSEVMSFAEGFTFLGEDFGPRYPPALDDHRAVEPPRRVVYVGRQGSRVRIASGRLVVESADDQTLLDVPSGQVERLVCYGAVGLSAGARSWALANGVDLLFLSRRGSYLGHGRGGRGPFAGDEVAGAACDERRRRALPEVRPGGRRGEGTQADRGATAAGTADERRYRLGGGRADGPTARDAARRDGPRRVDGHGRRGGASVLRRPREDHARGAGLRRAVETAAAGRRQRRPVLRVRDPRGGGGVGALRGWPGPGCRAPARRRRPPTADPAWHWT